jgi:hypothetical protein
MANLALGLAIVLAVATATFYVAAQLGHGSPFASDVCALSRELCEHPMWLAAATGIVALIYLILRGMRF